MFDFDSILRRALQSIGDADVAIAMPYELPDRMCRDLIADGYARSMVVDSARVATLDDSCAGWWIDRSAGLMHLRLGSAKTLLIAGIHHDRRLHPGLLLEARLKGVRRIVTADASGEIVEDLEVSSALHERLRSMHSGPPIAGCSYEAAFETLYELVADRLRLPAAAFAPRKVALCLGSLGPGGAERQGSYTAAGAKQFGFETSIICNHIAPPADFFRAYVESRGVGIVQVPEIPLELEDPKLRAIPALLDEQFPALNMSNVFLEILRYASVLRALRPGLVHSWMDYPNVLCGTAAELVGVPGLILSGRSVAPNHFRIFQPYMRPGYRSLLRRRSALLLNNSSAGADDYASWLNIEREGINVIHNGFDFPPASGPEVRSQVRKLYGIGENAFVVGSILRFSEEKRPKLLVDMAAAMLVRNPEVRFLFFGEGVLLEPMRAYVRKLGIASAVFMPGLTRTTWEVLSAMDLFALTSRLEGLPNVLIEAQASGLPVVCTGVGGMQEAFIHGKTGFACQDASATSLAEAALSIFQNPERLKRMAEDASEHARREFGLAHMIQETIEVYEQASGAEGRCQRSRKLA